MQSITQQPEQPGPPVSETSAERACPACGTMARRSTAQFCATCGHSLDADYLPADTLRASYFPQQRRPGRRGQKSGQQPAAQARATAQRQDIRPPVQTYAHAPLENGAATTALAFVTYSLVPYLGILFCPGAIVMGGLGLLRWHRAPQRGGRRTSYAGIIFGLVILCVQILLWWILYKVPQWARL